MIHANQEAFVQMLNELLTTTSASTAAVTAPSLAFPTGNVARLCVYMTVQMLTIDIEVSARVDWQTQTLLNDNSILFMDSFYFR